MQNKRVTENTINQNYNRLMKLASDIFNHYDKNLKNTNFNAMLAVSSKYQALKMKEIFDAYHNLETEVIISSESTENEEDENRIT